MGTRAVRLHQPVNDTGRKAYCGPTALSAITGQPVSRFATPGRGYMRSFELQHLLRQHGFKVQRTVGRSRMKPGHAKRNLKPSLGPLWKALPLSGFGVAVMRNHFIAFHGKMVLDTHRKNPTWVFDHPYARCMTVMLILVEAA